MPIDDHELMRQDEEISAAEFAGEESRDRHDFGNWPEVAGLVFTLFVLRLMFAFTG